MATRWSATLLLALSLILMAVPFAPAEERDPVSLFRMSTLEVYLQRADRERDEQGWLLLARDGRQAAVGAWEREAVLLY